MRSVSLRPISLLTTIELRFFIISLLDSHAGFLLLFSSLAGVQAEADRGAAAGRAPAEAAAAGTRLPGVAAAAAAGGAAAPPAGQEAAVPLQGPGAGEQ